jgi:hypothetical protein
MIKLIVMEQFIRLQKKERKEKKQNERIIPGIIPSKIPVQIFFISIRLAIFLIVSSDSINAVSGELSLASTGTEFFTMTKNIPIIKTLYNDTELFIYINEDDIPDYSLRINKTDRQNNGLIKINPPWKTSIGSRIISTKPIIYKQLSYRKDHTGKMTIEKYYCPVPDMNSYKNMYLATPGIHNIVSEQDIPITIMGKRKSNVNNNQTFLLKRNIPLTISLTEYSLIISKKKFISFNNVCKDSIFSKEFYSSENVIEITPSIEFIDFDDPDEYYNYNVSQNNTLVPTGKNNTQQIKIDSNNDDIIDQILDISKTVRLKNVAPGTHFISDKPFAMTQYMNVSGIIVVGFSFDGFIRRSKEHIFEIFDEEIKESSAKIVSIWNSIANNVFYPKINGFYWNINSSSVGLEIIQKYQSYAFLMFSPEIVIPQISTVSYVDSNGNDIIRIFNPHKTLDYTNLTVRLSCDSSISEECIKGIYLKDLNNDFVDYDFEINKISTVGFYIEHLPRNSYLEITGKGIKKYEIRCNDVEK